MSYLRVSLGCVLASCLLGCPTEHPDQSWEGILIDGYWVAGDPYSGYEPQGTPVEERTWVVRDAEELAERVTLSDEPITLQAAAGKPGSASSVKLTLIATIDGPWAPGHYPEDYEVDEHGDRHHNDEAHKHPDFHLQANTVLIRGDTVIASYHVLGNVLAGVIDVIDISDPTTPVLVSSAGFDHMDFSSITYHPDNDSASSGWVFAAASTCDPHYQPYTAVVEQFRIEGRQIEPSPSHRFGVPGAASTGVAVGGSATFVSSGDFGGLTVIDFLDRTRIAHFPIADARWVDMNDGVGVVLTGSATTAEHAPATLQFYDPDSLQLLNSIPFEGLDVAWAKGTVDIVGRQAYTAAGMGGLKVFGVDSGKLLAQLTLPADSGHTATVGATTAVTTDGATVFMPTGARGVWTATAPATTVGVDTPFQLTTLGSFDSAGSVNHAAFNGQILALASGTKGVQIIRVDKN